MYRFVFKEKYFINKEKNTELYLEKISVSSIYLQISNNQNVRKII